MKKPASITTIKAPLNAAALMNRPVGGNIVVEPIAPVADEPPLPVTVPDVPVITTAVPVGWTRQDFPSRSRVYSLKEIQVKALTVSTLKKLAAAIRAKSFTLMLDALDHHITLDIRDLTVPDFYFFLYWLRINSYLRSPYLLTWTSKYGNENTTRITMPILSIKELEMTEHELAEWREKGLDIPRIRDMEILSNDELSTEDRWEIEYAQYVYAEVNENYLSTKLEVFNEGGPDMVSDIEAFSTRIQHGVTESVRVTDERFEMDAAIAYLTEEIETLTNMANTMLEENDPKGMGAANGLLKHLEKRTALLSRLEFAKKNEEEYEPEEEVVALDTIDATKLFP